MTMTIERAREITGKCVESAFSRIMGDKYVPLPADVSLEDMLIANRMVSAEGMIDNGDGTKRMQMVVDPRGIALHYAFENYGSNPYQLLEALGYEVKP